MLILQSDPVVLKYEGYLCCTKKLSVSSPFLSPFVELGLVMIFLWLQLVVIFCGTYIEKDACPYSFIVFLKFQSKYLLKSSIFQKIFWKLSFVHVTLLEFVSQQQIHIFLGTE